MTLTLQQARMKIKADAEFYKDQAKRHFRQYPNLSKEYKFAADELLSVWLLLSTVKKLK